LAPAEGVTAKPASATAKPADSPVVDEQFTCVVKLMVLYVPFNRTTKPCLDWFKTGEDGMETTPLISVALTVFPAKETVPLFVLKP
jgi:hypothetical protein